MTQTPVFSSAAEAADLARAGLRYLAAADPTQLTASEQAECLHDLERITAVTTAARANVLGGFTAGQGYCEDADYSPRSWLIHKTRITKGAATGHTAWVRRARAHPRIMAVLADGEMSEPYARTLCGWTDQLPEECRDTADAILVAAAGRGMDLRDLATLAAEIQSRACPAPGDEDPGKAFEDRAVRLETTFQGAGVFTGDLTPECTPLGGGGLAGLSPPRWSAPSWRRCPPRAARRTPAVTPSGTTTPWKKRCTGWSAPGCSRSGPVSPRRRGRIFPWPT